MNVTQEKKYNTKTIYWYGFNLNNDIKPKSIKDITVNFEEALSDSRINRTFNLGIIYQCHLENYSIKIDKILREDDILDYINKNLKDKKEEAKNYILSGCPNPNYNLFSRDEIIELIKNKNTLQEYYMNRKNRLKEENELGRYPVGTLKLLESSFKSFEQNYFNNKYDEDIMYIGKQKYSKKDFIGKLNEST